jgi:WD40 repeat protein
VRGSPWHAYRVGPLSTERGPEAHLDSVKLTMPDHIIVAGDDGTVRILDMVGYVTQTVAGGGGIVIYAALSPDKERVALALAGGSAEIIDLATGKRNGVARGHEGWIMGLAFTPDSKRLVTAGADDTVRFWDLAGQPAGKPLQAGQGQVLGVAVSPRGDLIVTAGDDGTVKLWTALGEGMSQLIGHRGKVLGVGFNPDGTLVATSGVDGTFRLWSVTGATLARYPSHVGPLATEASGGDFGTPSVGFSPDGRSVAVPANGGIVRVWRIQSLDELLQRACDWSTDYFASHPSAPGMCT